MANLIVYLSSSAVSLIILSYMVKLLKKVWWNPIRIQSIMRSQGIKGPSYRFLHGNTKEIMNMEVNAKKNPIELSNHHLLPTVLPHIYSWTNLYGKNFFSWLGPRAHFTVTEPELIKEILNNKDGMFPKGEPDGFIKNLLGDGIILTRGEKWFKLRKLSNHAFHAESLKGMIPAMIASVEIMLERWRKHEGKEIEVLQEFKVLTSEVISRTAFGSSYSEGQHIFYMLIRLAALSYKNKYRIRIPGIGNILKTQDDIESDRIEQEMRSSFLIMIEKREEMAMKSQADGFGNDFLGLLIKAHHENDLAKRISVDDLIDECKNFYVAGQETTTNSLTWTLFLLAIHTDWQDRAREEVLQIFGTSNPCPESLTKLKIMNMIIHEALRLYPPVVSLSRDVNRQVRLGKLIIPANIEMEIPILAVHDNPQIWGEDVHLFKPERFAEGIAKATNNNVAAYLPFGFGPRSCVGSNFAITETKIALSMILQRYRLVLSSNYIHSPLVILTMCPQHGLQIILQPL